MGQLFDLIQAHMDQQTYPVSQRKVARKLGVAPTTLGNWREPTGLVSRAKLEAIAAMTGHPYPRVLDALLRDLGYLD